MSANIASRHYNRRAPSLRSPSVGDSKIACLLADLRQDLGNFLLAVDHLGKEADAIDFAGAIPARLDQDSGLLLGRDGQPVQHVGKRLSIEFTEFFGYIFDRIHAGIPLEAVVVRNVVEA